MKKELTPTTTKGELLQDKHTPLPWHIVEVIDSTGIISIASEKFGGGCVIPHAGKHKPEHEANAELIVKAVNERQKLLDSNRELIEKLTMAKSAYFHLKMELNPKWDYAKDVYYQEFLETINNAKNIQP